MQRALRVGDGEARNHEPGHQCRQRRRERPDHGTPPEDENAPRPIVAVVVEEVAQRGRGPRRFRLHPVQVIAGDVQLDAHQLQQGESGRPQAVDDERAEEDSEEQSGRQ